MHEQSLRNLIGYGLFDAVLEQSPLERIRELGLLVEVQTQRTNFAIGSFEEILEQAARVFAAGAVTLCGQTRVCLRRKLVGECNADLGSFARVEPFENHCLVSMLKLGKRCACWNLQFDKFQKSLTEFVRPCQVRWNRMESQFVKA